MLFWDRQVFLKSFNLRKTVQITTTWFRLVPSLRIGTVTDSGVKDTFRRYPAPVTAYLENKQTNGPIPLKIQKFEDVDIWQHARTLCQRIFELTSREPFCKDFRFRDQIRASSGSIMDNTAEGFERGGNKEFIQFLAIAKGSCGETTLRPTAP